MTKMNSELVDTDLSGISDSSLINEDLAATKVSQRTWGTYNIAALWVGMSVCIPTYLLASGLIAGRNELVAGADDNCTR